MKTPRLKISRYRPLVGMLPVVNPSRERDLEASSTDAFRPQ
jgi:hypothetical protein